MDTEGLEKICKGCAPRVDLGVGWGGVLEGAGRPVGTEGRSLSGWECLELKKMGLYD